MQNAAEDEQELLQWIANRNQLNQFQGVRLTEIQKYGPSRLRKRNILSPTLTSLWKQNKIFYTKNGNRTLIFPILMYSQFSTQFQQTSPHNQLANSWSGNGYNSLFVSSNQCDGSINFQNNTYRDYSGYRIQNALDQIAQTPDVVRRWPRTAKALDRIAVVLYDIEHDMDWCLAGDTILPNDSAFDAQCLARLQESIMENLP